MLTASEASKLAKLAQICGNCRWWSETCARAIGRKPLEALCENPNSHRSGTFTIGTGTCSHYEDVMNYARD
jgi:hypothetical protein